ncbi:hypothetical protein GCM10010862_46780 [Devosia nitrariae]|uniref:Uncharacterized protein n=2 Tax=Devosia nitrariae TaxID=2071872 RepID=A0ABQ5WCD9_9HYPH|nr:hypothetical protein GCM10010862_46780 [Devosia nitrariae]
MRNPSFISIVFLVTLLTAPVAAQSRCPQPPADSGNPTAESGREQMLCRHDTLTQTITGFEDKARFDDLAASVQRLNLQRRFDALPPPPRFTFQP